MSRIKTALSVSKDIVVANRTRILLTTTAVAVGIVALQRSGLKQHDEFLESHGLKDEFYAQTDDETTEA